MKRIMLLCLTAIVMLVGCGSDSEQYREYLVCVNGECDLYVGVVELEVCINKWDANLYNFTTDCYNILDIDREKSNKTP